MTSSVLHVTAVWGGGIQTSVEAIVNSTTEYRHTVFARIETESNQSSVMGLFFPKSKLRFLFSAARHLLTNSYDVIHLHSSHAGLLRLLFWKSNFVYSPHCFAFERMDLTKPVKNFYRLIESALARRAVIWSISPYEASLASTVGANRVVIGNNFAARTHWSARTRKVETKRTFHIAFIGRIDTQKDPDFAIAVARVLSVDQGYAFTWIGSGDKKSQATLISSGISVTGWLAPSELTAKLENTDAVVHTALWEGSPLALLEAASLGLPIITRTIDSLKSLGYYSAGDKPSEVAEGIRALGNVNFLDEIVGRSRSITLSNSGERMIESIEEAYGLITGEAL